MNKLSTVPLHRCWQMGSRQLLQIWTGWGGKLVTWWNIEAGSSHVKIQQTCATFAEMPSQDTVTNRWYCKPWRCHNGLYQSKQKVKTFHQSQCLIYSVSGVAPVPNNEGLCGRATVFRNSGAFCDAGLLIGSMCVVWRACLSEAEVHLITLNMQ